MYWLVELYFSSNIQLNLDSWQSIKIIVNQPYTCSSIEKKLNVRYNIETWRNENHVCTHSLKGFCYLSKTTCDLVGHGASHWSKAHITLEKPGLKFGQTLYCFNLSHGFVQKKQRTHANHKFRVKRDSMHVALFFIHYSLGTHVTTHFRNLAKLFRTKF